MAEAKVLEYTEGVLSKQERYYAELLGAGRGSQEPEPSPASCGRHHSRCVTRLLLLSACAWAVAQLSSGAAASRHSPPLLPPTQPPRSASAA